MVPAESQLAGWACAATGFAPDGEPVFSGRARGRQPASFLARRFDTGWQAVCVTATSGNAFATVAYNAATGARRWVRRYPGAAISLAVSPVTGTVFVTGGTSSCRVAPHDVSARGSGIQPIPDRLKDPPPRSGSRCRRASRGPPEAALAP